MSLVLSIPTDCTVFYIIWICWSHFSAFECGLLWQKNH